jgi:hypothetical protein
MARPPKRVRPPIELSEAYVSKVGRECQQMWEVVDKAAGRAVDESTRRELALVAERLAQMAVMFL